MWSFFVENSKGPLDKASCVVNEGVSIPCIWKILSERFMVKWQSKLNHRVVSLRMFPIPNPTLHAAFQIPNFALCHTPLAQYPYLAKVCERECNVCHPN